MHVARRAVQTIGAEKPDIVYRVHLGPGRTAGVFTKGGDHLGCSLVKFVHLDDTVAGPRLVQCVPEPRR